MTSIFRRKEKSHPSDITIEYKATGVAGDGSTVYAEVLALEPGSIGGGGTGSAVTIADGANVAQGTTSDAAWVSGPGTVISLLKKIASAGGSAVSVADGADAAQGTTTDLASANTVVGLLKNLKAALAGTLSTSVSNFPATQPVSGSVAVSNFPATQPVSLATNTPDVTDRAARLLGHVTVDNASIPVTGPLTDTQLRASAVPVDTELPTAAVLSDNVANPTTPMAGAATMLWDSTLNAGAGGWVRAPGSVASGLKVQSGQLPTALAANGGLKIEGVAAGVAVPVSGTFFQGTQPVSLAAPVDVSDRAARLVGVTSSEGAVAATPPTNATYLGLRDNSALLQFVRAQRDSADGETVQANNLLGTSDRPYLFNGTTWDRQRGNLNTTTGDTGAKTANFLGATQTNFNARGAIITLIVGTVGGTFTTFQTGIQWSPDGGTTWISLTPLGANITAPVSGNTIVWNVYPGALTVVPAASGGTAAPTQYNTAGVALPRTWRFAITLAGTTPSLAVTSVNVNYIQ